MRALPALTSFLFLLAFATHPAFTSVEAIGGAKSRLKMDSTYVSDLLGDREVVGIMSDSKASSETNEDDESGDVLMSAKPRRLPIYYKCIYDFKTGKKRCWPSTKLVHLRH